MTKHGLIGLIDHICLYVEDSMILKYHHSTYLRRWNQREITRFTCVTAQFLSL